MTHSPKDDGILLGDYLDPRNGSRCRVWISRERWNHVVERHVSNRDEPWSEWLGQTQIKQLIDWQSGKLNEASVNAPLKTASELLALDVKQSMERPLVLFFDDGSSSRRIAKMVLPHGAVAIVRGDTKNWSFKTCYFPNAVCGEFKSSHRWRQTVNCCVTRYAQLDSALRQLVPPSAEHAIIVSNAGVKRRQSNIRFVALEEWGFRTDLDGSPWRAPLKSWKEDAVKPVSKPRKKLRPRYRIVEEEVTYD